MFPACASASVSRSSSSSIGARAGAAADTDAELSARIEVLAAQVAMGERKLGQVAEHARLAVAISEPAGHADVICEALEILGRQARQSATRTGTDARYATEWLAGHTAGWYVQFEADSGRYSMTPEQAHSMAGPQGPNLPAAVRVALGTLPAAPRITDAFPHRRWDGLARARFRRLQGHGSFSSQQGCLLPEIHYY